MNKARDQAKYADYLHGQVRELLTEFGKIDIAVVRLLLSPGGLAAARARARRLAERKTLRAGPQAAAAIILERPPGPARAWDIKTPEQFQPREWVTV